MHVCRVGEHEAAPTDLAATIKRDNLGLTAEGGLERKMGAKVTEGPQREVNEIPRNQRIQQRAQSNGLGEDMTVAHWKVSAEFDVW